MKVFSYTLYYHWLNEISSQIRSSTQYATI